MSAVDRFANFAQSWASPPPGRIAVTPSDVDPLPFTTTAVRATGSGNLRLMNADGTDIAFPVAAGEEVPGQFTRVFATGTTATGIIAIK